MYLILYFEILCVTDILTLHFEKYCKSIYQLTLDFEIMFVIDLTVYFEIPIDCFNSIRHKAKIYKRTCKQDIINTQCKDI